MIRTSLILALTLLCSVPAYCQADTVETEKESKWGFGGELGPCTGIYFLSGDAKQKLSEGWCYANAGVIISYSRVHFMLQVGGVSGSIREELSYGPEWKKENHFGSSNLQLSVGYELLNEKHLNIIPFVTGGMTAFNTRPDSTGSRGVATRFVGPSYAIGTAFDFKLNFPMFKKNRKPSVVYTMGYLYLRVMTGIYPTYFHPLDMNGGLGFVNVSLGFYASGRHAK